MLANSDNCSKMTTKLVYVLTCAPEKHYIEQALIAVFSARYWNPNAHIVLLVDDLTDQLFVGKRAQILDFLTEKIVVPFEDATLSPMYRSRWIKTSVRQLVKGDFMFVDCDTVVCKSLSDIDTFDCEVGAVLESHLLVEDFCSGLRKKAIALNQKIGVDLNLEKEFPNCKIILERMFPDVDVVVSYRSTLAVEYQALNKSVFMYEINTIDEIIEKINELKNKA